MEQWEFIERAADGLGITAENFRKWRTRGVPRMYRLEIVELAVKAGFALDKRAFDAPPGSKRAVAHAEQAA